MHKNSHAPVIGAAVNAARAAIQGATGAGSAFAGSAFQGSFVGGAAPPQNLTRLDPETGRTQWGFMIGVDAIGDPNATFLEDGRVYDFGN